MGYTIFVVSDGTGRTAQQALQAALTQYPKISVDIKVRPGVRSLDDIRAIVKEAIYAKAFIVHTLVQHDVRHEMVRAGRINNIETIDLMGGFLSRLSHLFVNSPEEKPGLFHEINKEYFQRIDSMQFAFTHDDGLRYHELDKAEIVLIGVSRTFKTPLSIYLAFKGWFVANIPIISGVEPPNEIYNIPPEKVFCLTNNAKRLSVLRQSREEYLGGHTGDYATLDHVKRELNWSQLIFNRQPRWPIIKVTSKPIEEIASEILAIKGKASH